MSTVPPADLIAVFIGIAVVVMAVATSMAPVIIVVAIVLLVAVSVVLSHSDCRREGQRQDCSRAGSEPSLNRHFTPSVSPQRSSLQKRPRHRQITVGHGRRYFLSFVYLSFLLWFLFCKRLYLERHLPRIVCTVQPSVHARYGLPKGTNVSMTTI